MARVVLKFREQKDGQTTRMDFTAISVVPTAEIVERGAGFLRYKIPNGRIYTVPWKHVVWVVEEPKPTEGAQPVEVVEEKPSFYEEAELGTD